MPLISWHATGRLSLDRDGILWRWAGERWVRLGAIESCEVPAKLERERDEILSLWRDGFSDRDEQMQPLR